MWMCFFYNLKTFKLFVFCYFGTSKSIQSLLTPATPPKTYPTGNTHENNPTTVNPTVLRQSPTSQAQSRYSLTLRVIYITKKRHAMFHVLYVIQAATATFYVATSVHQRSSLKRNCGCRHVARRGRRTVSRQCRADDGVCVTIGV